jgi:hypothetical protein
VSVALFIQHAKRMRHIILSSVACPFLTELFHADGRTDRQAGRQTDRQAGRQAGRQADRQTDRRDEASSRFSEFFEHA